MTTNNLLIIDLFNNLVKKKQHDMYHLKDKSAIRTQFYKIQALKNVINIIGNLPKINNIKDVANVKGIGKKSLIRINEILTSGKLKELELFNLRNKYDNIIDELTKVYGIGYKTALSLIVNHNIKSISDLKKYANKKNDLHNNIKIGIKYIDILKRRIHRSEMIKIDSFLHNKITKIDVHLFGIICGSYRRQKLFSNDIDLLIVHPDIKTKSEIKSKENYLNILVSTLIECKFIVDSLTSTSVTSKYMGFAKLHNCPVRRIDIRYIPFESYYSALLYFTGSKIFNTKIRNIAINAGYKLNEYGLFDIINNKLIMLESEHHLFNILNIDYVEPKDR